jgi:hypothetical protein
MRCGCKWRRLRALRAATGEHANSIRYNSNASALSRAFRRLVAARGAATGRGAPARPRAAPRRGPAPAGPALPAKRAPPLSRAAVFRDVVRRLRKCVTQAAAAPRRFAAISDKGVVSTPHGPPWHLFACCALLAARCAAALPARCAPAPRRVPDAPPRLAANSFGGGFKPASAAASPFGAAPQVRPARACRSAWLCAARPLRLRSRSARVADLRLCPSPCASAGREPFWRCARARLRRRAGRRLRRARAQRLRRRGACLPAARGLEAARI